MTIVGHIVRWLKYSLAFYPKWLKSILAFTGELLITIMSSLAQEESRSISENTTWGQRKRFADGIMSLGYSNFLGYKKGANPGDMEIVEEEAVIVCRIYRIPAHT